MDVICTGKKCWHGCGSKKCSPKSGSTLEHLLLLKTMNTRCNLSMDPCDMPLDFHTSHEHFMVGTIEYLIRRQVYHNSPWERNDAPAQLYASFLWIDVKNPTSFSKYVHLNKDYQATLGLKELLLICITKFTCCHPKVQHSNGRAMTGTAQLNN